MYREERKDWMKKKYEELKFYRSYQGLLNMCPYALRSKKKMAWEHKFLRLVGSTIEIYATQDSQEAEETLDLILCSFKDHREIDLSFVVVSQSSSSQPNFDPFNCFQIITPKQGISSHLLSFDSLALCGN